MEIGIIGATGYSGNVLYSLLKQHPQVTKINLYGHQQTNSTTSYLDEEIPSFQGEHLPLQAFNAEKIMAENDCLFFATPAGVAKQLATPLLAADFPIIDLSGDFRLKDPAEYSKWYQQPAAPAEQLAKAEYGLCEFNDHPTAAYIANPGCYATATLLGLAPLIIEHLIELKSIVVDAKSGVSGAGKKLSASSHFSFINENAWLYKLNQHKHIPEILQQMQNWDDQVQAVQFSTTLIPITRGIMATIYAQLKPGITPKQIDDVYRKHYQTKPFVRWRSTELPMIKNVTGSNYCDLGYGYNPATNVITVVSVIDNLLKGAAGQAVQNFNLMWHFPETTGLPQLPIFP
ncbi:MAG: N-acetyl-gamma-glutamyl-phosphate reductase [Liquorilactobacillus ghanensis]|jgi:N-acetyl-gamma-glutamyl-phosphate reductase|uniref:N-acetyl-gamma-glutamyl-phosphate reductase n=1 Tax=Liquorilactobacillus TaxID=2767888 RepID=UPI0039E904D7